MRARPARARRLATHRVPAAPCPVATLAAGPATARVALAVLVPLLLATGCGDAGATRQPQEAVPVTARLYGADANMTNSFGDQFQDLPGALFGMRGTTPTVRLPEEFAARLRAADPTVSDLTYAGEAYDAVAVVAVAAEYARTTSPPVVARAMVGVTTGGVLCQTVPACLAAARTGQDLQYRGFSLRRGGFTDVGEPATATYGVVGFSRDNRVDATRIEYLDTGDEHAQSSAQAPAPGRLLRSTAPLRLGGLLPHTGRLAQFGRVVTVAVRLAIADVNAAGGVLGRDVVWVDGDDGSSQQVAATTADRLLAEGVHAVIGAGASGVTRAVLPKVTGAGRILISPTSTSDELTTVDDNGMFFRTAPPDTLQGRALADVVMRDGPRRVAIVAIDDPYGTGLQDVVQSNLVLAGLPASSIRRARYPARDSYDPSGSASAAFGPIAADVRAFAPDAVLVIGSNESSQLIRALLGAKPPAS